MTKMAILGRGSMRDKQKVSVCNESSSNFWQWEQVYRKENIQQWNVTRFKDKYRWSVRSWLQNSLSFTTLTCNFCSTLHNWQTFSSTKARVFLDSMIRVRLLKIFQTCIDVCRLQQHSRKLTFVPSWASSSHIILSSETMFEHFFMSTNRSSKWFLLPR